MSAPWFNSNQTRTAKNAATAFCPSGAHELLLTGMRQLTSPFQYCLALAHLLGKRRTSDNARNKHRNCGRHLGVCVSCTVIVYDTNKNQEVQRF